MKDQLTYHQQKLAYETDPSDLFKELKNGDGIIVVDARSAGAYDIEHIPGAISLPHREMNLENTHDLKKNILYIVYCDGIGCNASTKGAINMLKLGFSVKELMGGLDWWKKDGYETDGSGATSGNGIDCAC